MSKEIEKLEKLIKSKRTDICIRRIQCVLLQVKEKWNSEKIGAVVGYTPSYIREVQSLYKKHGEKMFYLKGTGGRYNENMTVEEEKEFLKKFEKRAGEGKFIDTTEIHKAYEEKIGRKVYRSVIYDLLDRNGWRKIMPRPKHTKNDPVKMENFKKGRVPRSNKENKGNSQRKESTIEGDVSR